MPTAFPPQEIGEKDVQELETPVAVKCVFELQGDVREVAEVSTGGKEGKEEGILEGEAGTRNSTAMVPKASAKDEIEESPKLSVDFDFDVDFRIGGLDR